MIRLEMTLPGNFPQVLVHAGADAEADALQLLGRTHGQNHVAELEHRFLKRAFHPLRILPPDAGNDDAFVGQAGDIADHLAGEVRVLDDEANALDLGGGVGHFLLEEEQFALRIDPENQAQQDDRQNDPDDAEGVGDRVGHGGQVCLLTAVRRGGHGLLGRAERGRVGGGPGKNPGHHAGFPAHPAARAEDDE